MTGCSVIMIKAIKNIHNTNTQSTMALDMNDLMAIRGVDRENDHGYNRGYGYYGGMSPYEQVKVSQMQSRHSSGVAIAGLTVASAAALAGIGAWIFAPLYGNAKAERAREAALAAKELANAQNAGTLALIQANNQSTNATLDRLIRALDGERGERISGDQTITQTITDTVSGSQQGTLTAMQQAELAASQVATQQVMTGLMTGRYSENPQRVALYQDAKPCPCPAGGCGCGCNG